MIFLPIFGETIIDEKDLFKYINGKDIKKEKLSILTKSNINSKNKDGFTPLMISLIRSDVQLLQFLLKYEPNLDIVDGENRTALMLAYEIEFIYGLKLLILERLKTKNNADDLYYVFYNSFLNENYDICKFMLKNGLKYSGFNHVIKGWTPLMSSVIFNDINLMKKLINMNINLDKKNEIKQSALKIAILWNNIEAAKILIRNGATYDESLVYGCVKMNRHEIIKKHININKSFYFDKNSYDNLLNVSIANKSMEVSEYLLDKHPKFINSISITETIIDDIIDKKYPVKFYDKFVNHAINRLSNVLKFGKKKEITNIIIQHSIESSIRNGDREYFKYIINNYKKIINKKVVEGILYKNIFIINAADIEFYLPYIGDINRIDKNGKTFLMLLGFYNSSIFNKILNDNPKVKLDTDKTSILNSIIRSWYFNRKDKENKLIELINLGANINISYRGKSILEYALKNNYNHLIKLLLQNKKIDDLWLKDETALHIVSRTGNIDFFNLIINKNPSINIQNCFGETPLIIALENKNSEIALKLIKNGADLNISNNSDKFPLQIAIENELTDVIDFITLNDYNIHPQFIDNGKMNSIINKIKYEKIAISLWKLLNKHKQSDKFSTIFMNKSIDKNWEELFNELIKDKKHLNKTDCFGETPIFEIVRKERYEMLEIIMNKADNINLQNNKGETILFISFINRNVWISNYLIENGVNPFIVNNEGKTAYQMLHGYLKYENKWKKIKFKIDNLKTKKGEI